MKKILYWLQGYKKIDEIAGLWQVSFKEFQGNETRFADYSIYSIYYNSKKDMYKLQMSGFRPMKHFLNTELRILIEYLNHKENEEDTLFYNTVEDYFTEKDNLFMLLSTPLGKVGSTNYDNNLMIIKFELDQNKEYIMQLRNSDVNMVKTIKSLKNSDVIPKGTEIYEELDNILITSDGYYVCTTNYMINKIEERLDLNDDDEDE